MANSRNLVLPETIRAELPERFPLLRKPPAPASCDPRVVVFGLSEHGVPVTMPERPRFEHTHVIGTTGGGKTNFLEHLIRQDIKKGDGVCVIDPHGDHPDSLYRSLITWLNAAGYLGKRQVHLIDPNLASYTTGFNPLALPHEETSVSVVAGVTLEAIERVWGDEDTHAKPTIRRLLKATFAALAELRLTLSEAELLFDQSDQRGVRAMALAELRDRYARAVLADLDLLARTDRNGLRFRDEVVGPLNRLAEFLSAPAIRRIVGQREHVLDLRACLDEGHIVLVNLSGGDAVHDADTELLGRLLTRFLFFHAKRRRTSKPFWFYLDECQRYLSGDIPSLLAEARKFAVGVVLSHQWQSQLGDVESQTLAAVHNATNLKAAFRIKHPKEAKEIAEAVMPLSLETPVAALIKPTIVGHRRTIFRSKARAESETFSTATAESVSEMSSEGFTESHGDSVGGAIGSMDVVGDGSASFSGSAQSAMSGSGVTMTPDMGWFQPPSIPLTETIANSSAISTSDGSVLSSMHSAGNSHNSSRGQSQSESTTTMRGTSTSTTTIEGYARGYSVAEGETEGLEPVYKDLPSAVHSYENVLYLAAQTLRALGAGQAYLHFVDADGMKAARVQVPRVQQRTVSDAVFAQLRGRILASSAYALKTDFATKAIDEREQELFAHCAAAVEKIEHLEPVVFRVPAPAKRVGRTR
jgi:Helicase HerA, central domain